MTVTVQSALGQVQASARRLRELVRELVLIAVEDQPRSTEVHLVTVINDAVLDLAAKAEEADAAIGLEQTAEGARPHAATPHQVARCQHHVTMLGAVLVRELAAPDLLNDLAALGHERGREATAWAAEIVRCIQACQIALWTDVQPALLAYWQELTDITDRACAPSDSG
jgi:hypothetical protein